MNNRIKSLVNQRYSEWKFSQNGIKYFELLRHSSLEFLESLIVPALSFTNVCVISTTIAVTAMELLRSFLSMA